MFEEQQQDQPETESGEVEAVTEALDEPFDENAIDTEPDADIEGGDEQPEAIDEGQETAELELAEVEWEDGNKYQIPKALESAFLKNADYTQKTQKLANDVRALQAETERLQLEESLAVEMIDTRAEINALMRQIQEAENIDWQAWEADDFIAAQSGWRQYSQMKDRIASLQHFYQSKASERSQAQQEATRQRLDETQTFAKTSIEGWTPQMDAEIKAAVLEQGFTEEQYNAAVNPQVYKLFHLAYLGSKALKAAKSPPMRAQKAVTPTRSLSSKGNPPAVKSLADMDMEEYAATRRKQMGMPG